MLRVLWLSATPGLYTADGKTNRYNGGGWIASLQLLIQSPSNDISLGLAFATKEESKKIETQSATYYLVKSQDTSTLKKIWKYYGGYKHPNPNLYRDEINAVINDFKPNVIHLFGMENIFSNCLLWKEINVPIIVHLQGILLPYSNAYWPSGQSSFCYMIDPTFREWIFRNGYVFGWRNMKIRAERERKLFAELKYAMGRTDWDRDVSGLLSNRKYFHVDEVLRPAFYENAGTWDSSKNKTIIYSTISDNTYKGLDLILKTAKELCLNTDIDFVWKIAGINEKSNIVRQTERITGINFKEVNIQYMGTLNEKEIVENLQEISIYVHPSYIDNSPNSVCEAQMIGAPVIACYVGGIPSLIENDETGWLIPSNAPFSLSSKITYILSHKDVCRSVARKGNQAARSRHNREKIKDSLIAVYKEVIQDYKQTKN